MGAAPRRREHDPHVLRAIESVQWKRIAGLREKRALSQTVVAARMGTSTSVVSTLEARGDVKLSTLQRYGAPIGEKLPIAV